MEKYAEIAVNIIGIPGVFDYAIPQHLETSAEPGCLVQVPYNKRPTQGVIVRIKSSTDFDGKIESISKLIEKEPLIPPAYLAMAERLADKYHQPLAGFIAMMLPVGLSRQPYVLYTANVPDDADLAQLSHMEIRLMEALNERGSLRSTQLEKAFGRFDWRRAMQKLVKKEWVLTSSILPPPKKVRKKVDTVRLHPDVDRNQLDDLNIGIEGGNAAQRRLKALRVLAKENAPVLISYLYAASNVNSADIRYLEDKGLLLTAKREVISDPVSGIEPEGTRKPELTDDQLSAWNIIQKELKKKAPKPILMRGITGSGKTELYMRAAESAATAGNQAVILVPEISLTPQTIQRFLDRFPGKVGVMHSRLTDSERYDTWRRAQKGDLDVLVGPRSALLTPMPNPGLIVLDECHDDSYYQEDGWAPSYHSQEAALALSEKTGACVILGSATPNVTQFFSAQQEKWPLIHLDKRISTRIGDSKEETQYSPLPQVDVVDMRAELRSGNSSIFSVELQTALMAVVEAKQQAILFLNRRGSATIVFCRDCGYTAKCPRCDFPLTQHIESNKLTCHTCGYSRGLLTTCPECGSKRIRRYGMGTERVEQAVKELIPHARTLRWDADTAIGRRSENVILSHFKNHNADILIGTQMLAKGLDLPLVTLVGVVLADVGLGFPDYRSAETAFQLLTQVAGRAGRSELGGRAIVQTFQPEHYAIQHTARHDFMGFYTEELGRRRDIQYPPFTKLVRLETRDIFSDKAEARARLLAEELDQRIKENKDRTLEMIGPVPPYFTRQRGYYRWQIILKGSHPGQLIDGLRLTDWLITVDPPHLL